MSQTEKLDVKKLGVINGLRGFAILSVLYYHVFSRLTPPGFKSFDYANIKILPFTYLSSSWFGVNLFFILSGFVLALPYFLEKREFTTPAHFKEFYLRRAKRMLPLYYFSVVFCIVFLSPPISLDTFPRDLLLMGGVLFNFTKDMWFPSYNWVLWSLGIEVWFSIIFPFLIISIRKFGILKVLVVVLLASLVTRIIGNAEIYNIGSPLLNPVKDSLLGRLDEFLWGMFLCYVYVNQRELSKKIGVAIPLFAGIALITLACFSWDYVMLKIMPRDLIPYISLILDMGIFFFAWALLMMKGGPIKWLFNNYPMQLLGVMCYSIYIWHGIAIKPLILEYDAMQIIEYYFLVLLLASLSYRFIEFGHEPNWRKLFLLESNN
jgi:peptidoglycan/LPS O-acetylase OafA/YrhL